MVIKSTVDFSHSGMELSLEFVTDLDSDGPFEESWGIKKYKNIFKNFIFIVSNYV